MQVTVVVTAAVVDSAIVLDVLNSKLKFTFLLEIFSWLMSLDLRSSWLRDVIYPVSGVHAHEHGAPNFLGLLSPLARCSQLLGAARAVCKE